MLKGEGKVAEVGDVGGHRIYISKDVTSDSAYPFKNGEEVTVEIDTKKQCLIIRKKEA